MAGGASSDPPHHPVQPPPPPPAPAPPTDPSLSIGKLCAALHAGPDVYHKAVAAWRAKFPISVLPDPGKDFVICEGSSGHASDQRMRGPANFSRSFAEFMAGWLCTDISYDKGDRLFAGHQYLEYEPQKCPRNPGARGFGRVNSGTWFEAAQLRANQLSAAVGGRGTKCAVAGLVWVSDASFGGKNTTWHGVYGAYKARNRSGCTSRKHVMTCKTCKAM